MDSIIYNHPHPKANNLYHHILHRCRRPPAHGGRHRRRPWRPCTGGRCRPLFFLCVLGATCTRTKMWRTHGPTTSSRGAERNNLKIEELDWEEKIIEDKIGKLIKLEDQQ